MQWIDARSQLFTAKPSVHYLALQTLSPRPSSFRPSSSLFGVTEEGGNKVTPQFYSTHMTHSIRLFFPFLEKEKADDEECGDWVTNFG